MPGAEASSRRRIAAALVAEVMLAAATASIIYRWASLPLSRLLAIEPALAAIMFAVGVSLGVLSLFPELGRLGKGEVSQQWRLSAFTLALMVPVAAFSAAQGHTGTARLLEIAGALRISAIVLLGFLAPLGALGLRRFGRSRRDLPG